MKRLNIHTVLTIAIFIFSSIILLTFIISGIGIMICVGLWLLSFSA